MAVGKSYPFYKVEEPYIELEKALPVEVVSTGHEVRTHRDYRWNNRRHLYSPYVILQRTGISPSEFREENKDSIPVDEIIIL